MKKSNQKDIFHVHTYRCRHAANVAEEMYVKKAIELGAMSITFTDHAPFPGNPFGNRMDIQQLPEYLQTLNSLKEKYQNVIEVKTGLEIEYLPGFQYYYECLKKSGQFDVMMIGQHFYEYADNSYNFSLPRGELQKKEAGGLCKAVMAGMKTGLFQVIAHPDRMFRYCGSWDKGMEQMSEELIKTALKYEITLEQNLSSIKTADYYRHEFWDLVPASSKTRIGIDAHEVNQLEEIEEYFRMEGKRIC
ncbi:MAG: PHP domain-containing protein [Lachnospiraceae bacterium]|nr:PHP domain-containing protein [Lachnospiraceae bacterium]